METLATGSVDFELGLNFKEEKHLKLPTSEVNRNERKRARDRERENGFLPLVRSKKKYLSTVFGIQLKFSVSNMCQISRESSAPWRAEEGFADVSLRLHHPTLFLLAAGSVFLGSMWLSGPEHLPPSQQDFTAHSPTQWPCWPAGWRVEEEEEEGDLWLLGSSASTSQSQIPQSFYMSRKTSGCYLNIHALYFHFANYILL